MASRKRPSKAVEEALRLARQTVEAKAPERRKAPAKKPAAGPRGAKDKIVAALKKLHPMD